MGELSWLQPFNLVSSYSKIGLRCSNEVPYIASSGKFQSRNRISNTIKDTTEYSVTKLLSNVTLVTKYILYKRYDKQRLVQTKIYDIPFMKNRNFLRKRNVNYFRRM